jgi:putative ABC transport system permease protein
MRLFARLKSWMRASVRRGDFEQEMQREMQSHVELYEAELLRSGLDAREARRRARAEFGSIEARKDECRQAVGLRLIDEARADVRYAIRLLWRSPGFTLVALLSLALGIGANTAIFSLIDTVLLKTLPVQDPHRLFFVDNTGGRSGGSNGPPYPCFERLRDHNQSLSGIAAFNEDRFKVTVDGAVERWSGQHASGNYFELLGIQAVHGRLLTPRDDSEFGRGGPDGPVAVISSRLWTQRFGADPRVLGKSVQVGTQWVTIVGVTAPDFFGLQVGSPIDITLPMMLAGDVLRSKETWWMSVVGRVKPDATIEQARADLDTLFDSYMIEIGQPRERRTNFPNIALVPAVRGLPGLRRVYSEPLLIVMAIVAVVLLIGCANVANLLLARASARQNEIAIRLSIGASRGRLVRQLLTEGLVLVALGTGAGFLFARWGVSFLLNMLSGPGREVLLSPQFDLRVLAFAGGVALLTALLFSLAPALRSTRVDIAKPAKTATVSSGRGTTRLGQALVMIQVMLAVVLLSGAALFLRTFHNLMSVQSGFEREGVLTVHIEATVPNRNMAPKSPEQQRIEHARLGGIWVDVAARVAALPGVSSAGVGTMSPLSGRDRGVRIDVGNAPGRDQDQRIHVNQVTGGYFDAMGIRPKEGRLMTAYDRAGSLRVAILNETAARTYFAGESPLGRKVSFARPRVEDRFEIVGVVSDTRYKDLRTPDDRMIYLPIEQSIDPITTAVLAVRAPGDVTRFVPSVRSVVDQAVPGGFVATVATLEQRVQASLVRERLLSMLAAFFAGLALILACMGVYGVIAYRAIRRTREIGIRIAIGARQRSVVWMIVRETVILLAVGATLGTILSFIVNRYLAGQLFGVTPHDPLAISTALLVLVAVTLAAGYMPARKASRIDPVIALRIE